jgi:hypothetical protein
MQRSDDPAVHSGRLVPAASEPESGAESFHLPIRWADAGAQSKRRTFTITAPLCEPCTLALGYASPHTTAHE